MENFSVALLLLFILSSAEAATNSDEVAALIEFKQSSVRSDPTNFLSNWVANSSNPCSFSGVTCSPVSLKGGGGRRVITINLTSAGLAGDLRLDNLLALKSLKEIHLSLNSFHGNLSHSQSLPCSFELVDISSNNFTTSLQKGFLSSCSKLKLLNLSRNSISGGGLPFSISLQQLDLSNNKITDVVENVLLSYTRIGNLTFLDLSNNHLSREIPANFFSSVLSSLQQLNLSNNNFSSSSNFAGFDFGKCENLSSLDLSNNGINGSGLPTTLSNCRHLQHLSLSNNRIGGGLPTFWENLSKLKHLSLANNRFSGRIPVELGRVCGTLIELDFSGNQLTGGLPWSFQNCLSLQRLNLGNNQLGGDFLDNIVGKLIHLRELYVQFNNITGELPLKSLMNCSSLEVIHLGSNEFTGEIPEETCSAFPSLRKLLIPNNFVSGSVPPGIARCSNLETIDLSFNYLSGAVPSEVWSLPELVDLVMWANNLSGEIPDVLCSRGTKLETLILSYNLISGVIPSSFTKCVNLIWVSLSGNRLAGKIPPGIGNLQSLAILQLGNNSLSGEIPADLGSCRNLIWLDINSNKFEGPIPPSLASQAGLIIPGIVSGKQFAFLRNEAGNMCPGAGVLFEFEGIRPERLANFPLVHSCPSTRIYTGTTVYSYPSNGSMIYLDLSYNLLSGKIPDAFGSMMYLQVLNLGHNELIGTIPASFAGLKMVMALDLSHNMLTGEIPGSLGTLTFLTDLDFSNNNLTGQIPSSGQLTTFPASRYDNNSGLCGLPLRPCNSGFIAHDPVAASGDRRMSLGSSLLIGVAFSLLILFSVMLILFKLKQHRKSEKNSKGTSSVENNTASGTASWKLSGAFEPLSINVAVFETPLKRLTFADLLEATNGFSADSLIGSGGFGEVYKAQLDDGSLVAIKKLIHITGQGDREFVAEMETIGKIKHRNLVPLLGYCKVGDERLLVYQYMKHGSLDIALQEKGKLGIKLDWAARKKIAIGSARGLAFLHHSCIPHIIHRDMKSSNVLLDENLDARVSDFGMARLVNALDTHLSVSTLAGTPGYVPPEYYQSFRCTTKGDVYSYGVVLLELLSGKKPIDPSDFGDNNLVGWAKQLVKENRSNEIFDPELLGQKSAEVELYKYLRIACECLDDRPLRRPTIIQVMAMFKELQTDTDSYSLEGFSIGHSTIDESGERPYNSSVETSQ